MSDGSLHLAFIGPGGPEVLVVMLVLLMMFGAKDAPRIFRKLNTIMSHIRNTAEHFKREVMYGDLATGPAPDHEESEYDDYGLGLHEDDAAIHEEETVAGTPDEAEGGDGDVERV